MYVRLYEYVYLRTYICTYVILLAQIKVFVPGRTWTFNSSYFPNHLIHLVHIWFDDRYRSKVLFSNTLTHAYDLKVKVMDLEIFNVKDLGLGICTR